MFVQVIKGKTSNPDAVRAAGEKWRADVGPGAIGYLGVTSGVSDDGTTIAIVRFSDEAAAKANSERPEQSSWFETTMLPALDGAPEFFESSDVTPLFDGGSDAAGFVQVMVMDVADRAKAEAAETPEMLEQLRSARPDLLGGLRIWISDTKAYDVAYFTSEADARKGESASEFSEPQEEFSALFNITEFIDLREPELF